MQLDLGLRRLRDMLERHVRQLQLELGLQRARPVLEGEVRQLQLELGLQDGDVLERDVRGVQLELGLQGQWPVLEWQVWQLQQQLRLQRRHLLERRVRQLQQQLRLQGWYVQPRPVQQLHELMRCLVVATLVLSAAPVRADDRDDARREFALGQAAEQRGDWPAAIEHYLRANDLVPHSFAVYNIALAYQRLGKLREAATWFDRYLAATTDPTERAKVERMLVELRGRPARVNVRSIPAAARVSIDGAPVGVTPYIGTLAAGAHRIAVEQAGVTEVREVRAEFGEPIELEVSVPRPVVPTVAPAPGERARWRSIAGIAALGAGAVTAAVGGYFALEARSAAGELDAFYQRGGTWDDERAALERSLDSSNRRAVGFAVAGGLVMAAGGVLYYLGRSPRRDDRWTVMPTERGAAMAWAGTF